MNCPLVSFFHFNLTCLEVSFENTFIIAILKSLSANSIILIISQSVSFDSSSDNGYLFVLFYIFNNFS